MCFLLSSVVDCVCKHAHAKYYSLVHWPPPRFLPLALEMRGRTLLPLTMQVALMPVCLVSTQVPLISCGTHSLKLLFIKKAVAVVGIVGETVGGAYAQGKINIRANAPSHFASK